MSLVLDCFLESGAVVSIDSRRLLIGWGKPVRKSVLEIDPDLPAFFFTDFFLTRQPPWIQYDEWRVIDADELSDCLQVFSAVCRSEWRLPSDVTFKHYFDDLIGWIDSGRLHKGVPYLFARTSDLMDKNNLQMCLKRGISTLQASNQFLYGHWDRSSGVLGVTPEVLFAHRNQSGIVETMALAGTAPLASCMDAFLKEEKMRNEHHWVVQAICSNLSKFGKIDVGEITIMKLNTLAHLWTPISLQLDQPFEFDRLVECLHPTPALGAFPYEEGKQWLSGFNRHTPRHYYGAPVGFQYMPEKISRCHVAIRNVQWNSTGMAIGAGCGVVKQSRFELEWEEILLKIRAIRNQLYL